MVLVMVVMRRTGGGDGEVLVALMTLGRNGNNGAGVKLGTGV